METITASITLPTENINAFADSQGYFEFIIDPHNPETPVANPESRIDYVKRLFLERSLAWFTQSAENQIRNLKNQEAQELVDQAKDALKQAITIN